MMDWNTYKSCKRAQFNQWKARHWRRKVQRLKRFLIRRAKRFISWLDPDYFSGLTKRAYDAGVEKTEAEHKKVAQHKARSLEGKRKQFRGNKRTRQTVLREAGYTCHYCGEFSGDLTVDHLIPLSRGGTNERSNLVAACQTCNSEKGSLKHTEVLR